MKEGERKKTWRNLAFRAVAALGIAVGGAIIFSSEVQAQEDEPQGTVCTMEIKGLGQNPRILTTCRTGEGNQQKVNDRVKLDGMCVAERTGNPPHPYILSMPKVDSLSIQKGLVILPGQHSAGPVENYPEVFAACANDPMSGLPVQVEVVGEGFLGQPEGAGPITGESEIPAFEPEINTTTPVSCEASIDTSSQVIIAECTADGSTPIDTNRAMARIRARLAQLSPVRLIGGKGQLMEAFRGLNSGYSDKFRAILPIKSEGGNVRVVIGDLQEPVSSTATVHPADFVCSVSTEAAGPNHTPPDAVGLVIDGQAGPAVNCVDYKPGMYGPVYEKNPLKNITAYLKEFYGLNKESTDNTGKVLIGLLVVWWAGLRIRKIFRVEKEVVNKERTRQDQYMRQVDDKAEKHTGVRPSSLPGYGHLETAEITERVVDGTVRPKDVDRDWGMHGGTAPVTSWVDRIFSSVRPERVSPSAQDGISTVDAKVDSSLGFPLRTLGGHTRKGEEGTVKEQESRAANRNEWHRDSDYKQRFGKAVNEVDKGLYGSPGKKDTNNDDYYDY